MSQRVPTRQCNSVFLLPPSTFAVRVVISRYSPLPSCCTVRKDSDGKGETEKRDRREVLEVSEGDLSGEVGGEEREL